MAIAIDRGLCELRATKLISLFSFCRNRRKSDFAGQFIPPHTSLHWRKLGITADV